jgi:hypothetical protein
MFGQLRQRMIAAAGFSSIVAVVWADSGYLPKGGPLPLRFAALALLRTNGVSQPAPMPSDAEGMTDEDNDIANGSEAVIPPLAGTNANASQAEIMEASSAPAIRPAQEPVISPQMLMQYFRGPTNGVAAGPTDPVPFLQPPPPGASVPAAKAKINP